MLQFEHVSKVYEGGTKAVDNINLNIENGEFIVFIGPSGCGKTTTMKMINRLIETTEGNIYIDHENIKDKNIVELRRSIGYVIQQIGLFPHMTIAENISLVPKLLNWSEDKRRARAEELLQLVNMDKAYLDRYPNELSGGQQQRIGVLRALAADPPLILMDEPFGALDPITRDGLQEEFKKLQQSLGKTIVFVTHDMDEAIKLADRIVIMRKGKIVQVGTPQEILSQPANEFVEEFIGKHRLIESRPTLQTVQQIMNDNPISINVDKAISEAIRVMKDHKVDSLLVVDDHYVLQGMIDIEMIEQNRKKHGNVKDIMETAIYKVEQHALLRDTIHKILRNGFRYVPVVDKEDKLIGIVTRASLANIVYDSIWGNGNGDSI
ncbi:MULTISPECIES: betaine/proline/choline family ABC transporter ATP-binding protein [Clostridia]|uniref:betaine/proline/choline family ABC transporter ATP-binding protein n=1 Tax=Clostridia TaxID=186801 RepID=UPI000EA3D76C|nr:MULTISPECIES: betaine/proline/choline family ABC transporter ATP-binding protein [Clostridia]NBJ69499.1 ATP-binding cassette domain-containing protein [Roseburia sp. 1XD42-34]RKI78573.1 ATP-binding cassette domain-containing protein [Clostridium sp. 1xD42-85]